MEKIALSKVPITLCIKIKGDRFPFLCPLAEQRKPLRTEHAERFDFNVRSGGLGRFDVEPMFLRLFYSGSNVLSLASPLIRKV
jgi:hypothetical protein